MTKENAAYEMMAEVLGTAKRDAQRDDLTGPEAIAGLAEEFATMFAADEDFDSTVFFAQIDAFAAPRLYPRPSKVSIVQLGDDKFIAHRGTHRIAKGTLDHCLAVRRGDEPELPPLRDSHFYGGRKV